MSKLYRFAGLGYNRLFVKTDEFRPPKKGEFFLSGAIPEVYRSVSDMGFSYHIMREATEDEIFCSCCGQKCIPEE